MWPSPSKKDFWPWGESLRNIAATLLEPYRALDALGRALRLQPGNIGKT